MINRLNRIEERYMELNKLLSSPDIAQNIKRMTDLAKEQSSLEKTVEVFRKYKKVEETIEELKELIKEEDMEMRELAQLELDEAKPLLSKLEDELHVLLIPKDPNDDKNVMVEIRGAAGGNEANIFCGDLFRMYLKYAETKKWKVEITNTEVNEGGGYSQVEFTVAGDAVYSLLKFESGAHRVQRVPQTESQGRIHTSTATVVVLPEADEVEVELNMGDVRIDTYRSSGAGGQSVNTTDSAVRVTHEPTGLIVTCQDGKSQHENKATALRVLRTRLYDRVMQEKADKEGAERRDKLGTGDRSEKVRTYNYPQNRVTDHRIGFTLQQLDRVMEGKLDPVVDALITEELQRKLEGKE